MSKGAFIRARNREIDALYRETAIRELKWLKSTRYGEDPEVTEEEIAAYERFMGSGGGCVSPEDEQF